MPRRTLFVTTALPYANGPFHIGHIMEYIQADIWVRFQRMRATRCISSAPTTRTARRSCSGRRPKATTPEALIAQVGQSHQRDYGRFHISFDNWYTTHSAENVELSQGIYRSLKAAGLIYAKPIEQFYDPVKDMFLPDRYIKGECPKCGTKDQYGDACENCGSTYAPTELSNPYSVLTGAKPELRTLGAPFLPSLRSEGRGIPAGMDRGNRRCSRRSRTRSRNGWAARQRKASSPTGTSRATRRTSASRFPTRPASTSTSGSTRRSAISRA